MDRPAVSVVITAFNQAPYVGAAIESALSQALSPSEVIVVDDGSTDGTREEIARFGGRVRLVSQPNQGVAGARNTGVRLVSGTLVAFLDGDDLWHPDKLDAQVRAWRRHPDAGLIAVQSAAFHSAVPDPSLMDAAADQAVVDCRDRVSDLIASNFVWTTSQVAIPTHVLRTVGDSDGRYRTCSDFDLYLRIARRWPVAVVNSRLCFWRYLPSSASGPLDERSLVWWPELAHVLREQAPQLPPPLAKAAISRAGKYMRDTASLACARGLESGRRSALGVVTRCIKDQPLDLKRWLFLLALSSPAPVGRTLQRGWRQITS